MRSKQWDERLPADADGLMAWCLAQPQDVLLDLLAFLAALTVDGVAHRQGGTSRQAHAGQLAKALDLDMAPWWTPSVDGFYGRLSKAQLIEAMRDAKVTASAPFDGVKKAEAAKMAAKALQGSGWLPEPLRAARSRGRSRATGSGYPRLQVNSAPIWSTI